MTESRSVFSAQHRIYNITLHSDRKSTPELESELDRASQDLLHDNYLQHPELPNGPYAVSVSIEIDRVQLKIDCIQTEQSRVASIRLSKFRLFFRDYAIICDNFYTAAREGQIYRLETIDSGRRALHDEAAESLITALAPDLITNAATARRLFTLIYVLHMRHL